MHCTPLNVSKHRVHGTLACSPGPVLTWVPHAGQAAAGPSAKAIIVAGAGHGMHGHERECVDAVMALLDKLPRLSE